MEFNNIEVFYQTVGNLKPFRLMTHHVLVMNVCFNCFCILGACEQKEQEKKQNYSKTCLLPIFNLKLKFIPAMQITHVN